MANQKNSSCLFYLFFLFLVGVGGYFIWHNYFSNPKSKAEAKKMSSAQNILTFDDICGMLNKNTDAKAGTLVGKGFKVKYGYKSSYDKWGDNYIIMQNENEDCKVLFSTDSKIDYFHIVFTKENGYLKFLEQLPNIKSNPENESDTASIRKISDKCIVRAAGFTIENNAYRVVVYQPKKEIEVKKDIEKPKKTPKQVEEYIPKGFLEDDTNIPQSKLQKKGKQGVILDGDESYAKTKKKVKTVEIYDPGL